ncbi:MAG: DUF2339 domain-containing protein, partial [Patescibacteria group bacterium]
MGILLSLILFGLCLMFPILVIRNTISVNKLKYRIQLLEAKIYYSQHPMDVRKEFVEQSNSTPDSSTGSKINQDFNISKSTSNTSYITDFTRTKPKEESQLYKFFTQNVLMKIGALCLILAIIWFLSLTYTYLSDEVRIVLGVLLGTGFFTFGTWYLQKKSIPGQVFTMLGATTILLSLSASSWLFGLLPSSIVTIGCLVVLSALLAISYIKDLRVMGCLSVFIAYIIPFLSLSENPSTMTLAIYYLIINFVLLGYSFI